LARKGGDEDDEEEGGTCAPDHGAVEFGDFAGRLQEGQAAPGRREPSRGGRDGTECLARREVEARPRSAGRRGVEGEEPGRGGGPNDFEKLRVLKLLSAHVFVGQSDKRRLYLSYQIYRCQVNFLDSRGSAFWSDSARRFGRGFEPSSRRALAGSFVSPAEPVERRCEVVVDRRLAASPDEERPQRGLCRRPALRREGDVRQLALRRHVARLELDGLAE